MFKSSKNLERSSKELDNNNQQGQAQTNIVSSNPRLSPQSPTVKSPFLSGNSFKNLYKRSPSSSESLLPTSSKHQSRIVAAMDNNQENQVRDPISQHLSDLIDFRRQRSKQLGKRSMNKHPATVLVLLAVSSLLWILSLKTR